jgi:hypothetical protein
MRFKTLFPLFILFLHAAATFGATFVVPPDRDLIRRADAIVLGSALSSYARATDVGGIETVTPFSVEEVIKGDGVATTLDVVEPGGYLDGRATIIAGIPRFREGARLLLFLTKSGADRWSVTEIALGKFTFEHARNGEALLLRDAAEISGWDPDLTSHRERQRSAERFLRFVRDEAAGRPGNEDYFVDGGSRFTPFATSLQPAPNVAPYTATSYTMLIAGSQGGRWAVFPNAVSFFSGTTTEPGAPGGGSTAIQTGIASWDNDCGSNVNYVYAGTDNGTHTQGLHAADGANTVLFERDLSSWGISPFSCSANGYSGTLGIGGITTASGTNVVNNETFVTTLEGDVEMNKGLANCTLLFNNGDFNSAVTHELGHTLGFRHADQTRDGSASCSGDPSLECATQAIMKSFITTGLNGALQTWDQHAVQAVYPGNVCAPGPTCTAPTITSQPTSPPPIMAGQSATLSVSASGTATLAYQWYVGNSGDTSSPVPGANGPNVTVAPTTTTSYWVKVSNGCGSANSVTVTVTVTANTPSAATKFFLVTPCRMIDTRDAVGPYGGPALASGAKRTITVAGVCGIPTGAVAISVNVAVVTPSAGGYLTLFAGPSTNPVPLASTINYQTGRTLANNAIVRVGSDTINVYNGGPTLNFVIDVNGYFK